MKVLNHAGTAIAAFAIAAVPALSTSIPYTLSATSFQAGVVQEIDARQDFTFSVSSPVDWAIQTKMTDFIDQVCTGTGVCGGNSRATVTLDNSSAFYSGAGEYYADISDLYSVGGNGDVTHNPKMFLACNTTTSSSFDPCMIALAPGTHTLHVRLYDQFGSSNSNAVAGVYSESTTTTVGPGASTISPEPANLFLLGAASALLLLAFRKRLTRN